MTVLLTSLRDVWSCLAGIRRPLVLLAAILALIPPGPALAQDQQAVSSEQLQVAGMLIDNGTDEPLYVLVSFTDSNMNAIEMLRAADLPVVTVEFGGLGEGVCEIVETGCDVSPCRRRLCQTGDPESPFWQLWQQDDTRTWSNSVLGGSQTMIEDGDIVAWSWSGVDPSLQPVSLNEVADKSGAPEKITAPGAWISERPESASDERPSTMNMVLSASVMVLIAAAGMALVRMRQGRAATAS